MHLLSTNNSFIKFNGKDMILQTSHKKVDGINGLGGMTLRGRVIDYEISDFGQKGPLNLQVLFFTKTLGHTALNINFYGDGTCLTQFSGYRGLEVFFLGKAEPDNMSLSAREGVPSF